MVRKFIGNRDWNLLRKIFTHCLFTYSNLSSPLFKLATRGNVKPSRVVYSLQTASLTLVMCDFSLTSECLSCPPMVSAVNFGGWTVTYFDLSVPCGHLDCITFSVRHILSWLGPVKSKHSKQVGHCKKRNNVLHLLGSICVVLLSPNLQDLILCTQCEILFIVIIILCVGLLTNKLPMMRHAGCG